VKISTIRVIDSHTGGEPTRLVLEGGPDLGDGPIADRVQRFKQHFDDYRCAIVNEPRGGDPWVGALLVEPHRADCALGVIYFNNVGYLGMCGHGTMGLIASLEFAGRLSPGAIKIDTPVGAVEVELRPDGRISVSNVLSYRSHSRVAVEVPTIGRVTGDVAWGGNWFFLVSNHDQIIDLSHVESLTDFSCLAADGKLVEGDVWILESLIGSTFEASFRWHDRNQGQIVPVITGSAHVTGENLLRLDPSDPFCWGIRA
jgi:4-hydroxyproline epimerase